MEALIDEPTIAERFPKFELSFRPFVQYLNDQRRHTSSDTMDQFYAHLIDQFEEAVALTDLPASGQSPDRLSDFFRLATVALLPIVGTAPTLPYAFGLPVPLRLFHYSPAFERLLAQFPSLTAKPREYGNSLEKQRFLYRLVLEKCYQIGLGSCGGPSFRFEQHIDGLTKYYQMEVNISFVEPHSVGPLPPLQPAWADFAQDGTPLPDGVTPLPLREFVFRGFSFFRVDDVTEAESIQQLREVFVHLPSATEPTLYHQFETAFRNLCGQPGLEIGIMSLPQVNGQYVYLPDSQQRSVFLRLTGTRIADCTDAESTELLETLIRNPQPQIFAGLAGLPRSEYQALVRQGIHSFLLYPIAVGGKVLGLLEMGSPRADTFTPTMLDQIERVIPLIQELLYYQLHAFEERLEQRIKTRFTSLQPAVEWKFYEAAWEEIRREQLTPEAGAEVPVRFPQVYPLYGAVDVRGSSTGRQKAIQQDLRSQLAAVHELLEQVPYPADPDRLNRLIDTSAHWQAQLADDSTPDQEYGTIQFLFETVHPFFRELLAQDTDLNPALLRYFARANAETGQFSQALTAYEQTMDRLNTTINTYIDQQETQLQTVFPHYFERYRTDGAEYTIYVGQSIAPGQPYGPDVRRRLARWQVASMVEVAQLTHRLRPELPLPLQTTQLILSHHHPVDISFRRDERRFDVEGSYSIRYEVLKKRIDKVQILGTPERLTQPDTLALVYSRAVEVDHYLPFIAELQAEGKLLPGIDYFDLEPVQGVANLKALRVRIAYDA